MKKYDGWTLKCGKYLRIGFCHDTRSEVIRHIEKLRGESWEKYRKMGQKIVKVKLVEVGDD